MYWPSRGWINSIQWSYFFWGGGHCLFAARKLPVNQYVVFWGHSAVLGLLRLSQEQEKKNKKRKKKSDIRTQIRVSQRMDDIKHSTLNSWTALCSQYAPSSRLTLPSTYPIQTRRLWTHRLGHAHAALRLRTTWELQAKVTLQKAT